MSKTTEFLGWANVLNYDPSKKDATGPVVGFPTVGFGDISNAYKTSLIPKTAPGSVGGAFSPSAFLNSVQSGGAMQSGVGAAQEQTPAGGVVGDTKDTSTGAGFVPNQILVDSLTKKLFGQKSVGEADAGKLEFDAWKGQFGIDTDKNFQDSVSRLDYEVKTWAANYGANAERLARMGLSNSGAVDVYGTGVMQAYLSAMNDLYLAKAEGDRQNAEAYKQYSDQYEADLAARTEAKNNKILQGYNYGLGLYTGDNMDAVTTMVRNAGYDEDEIGEIVARLGAVDPSMLPALQTQLAQDQTDINTAIDQLIKSGYTTEMAESAADIYRAKGWSEEKIAKVIQGANGLAGMQSAGQSATGDQALIAGVDAVKALFYDDSGNYLYTGSEAQKESIKQRLRGTEYDQIISQIDADLAASKSAAAKDELADIETTDVDSLTLAGVQTDIENAANTYGVDSEEYKNVAAKYEGQITEIIGNALKDPDKTAQAFEVANDTVISVADDNEITWGEASKEQKVFYVVERLGDLYQSGAVSEKTYTKLMSDYIKKDVDLYSNSVADYVDTVTYLESAEIPYNVKMSLIDVIAKNAELHSTYVYNGVDYIDNGKSKTGTFISIAKYDKQGQKHFNLVVNEASEAEDSQVRKVMKGGQDIYYVAGNIYVVDRIAGGEKIYKVDPNASKRVIMNAPMSKDNRQGELEMQNAFYNLVLRYAYAHQ